MVLLKSARIAALALAIISFPLFTAVLPDPSSSPDGRVSLSEAVEMGLEIAIQKAQSENFSGHYGPCIEIVAENTGKKGIRTMLTAGTWLYPDDSLEQNMLVTGDRLLAVLPGQKKTVSVYAMCGEASDNSPGGDAIFALGTEASEALVGLAELIGRNNWQNRTGQSAVWSLTDNYDLSGISGEDQHAVNTLRNYCAKARGIEAPSYMPPSPTRFEIPKPSSQTVTGKVFYELDRESSVTVGIYNQKGIFVAPFIKDRMQRAGRHGFEFEVDIYDIEAAPYYARVIVDGEEKVKVLVPVREE